MAVNPKTVMFTLLTVSEQKEKKKKYWFTRPETGESGWSEMEKSWQVAKYHWG